MARNTGQGYRVGPVTDRYQVKNAKGTYDKFTRDGQYVGTKVTGGPYKGVATLDGHRR